MVNPPSPIVKRWPVEMCLVCKKMDVLDKRKALDVYQNKCDLSSLMSP